MKNQKMFNTLLTPSLFFPSKLVFHDGAPEKPQSTPPINEETDEERVLNPKKLSKQLRDLNKWQILSPKERGNLQKVLKQYEDDLLKAPKASLTANSQAVLERIPKIPELDNLGKKLSEYAKNLPKGGKIFNLPPPSICKLLIIKEGKTVKVSKVECILSDMTFKDDYYFDAVSGKYLKGSLTINDRGQISKHENEGNPNELLKIVPPLISQSTRT